MNKELKILLLEDVQTDADLNEHELRKAGIKFSSKRVDTRDDFTKGLEEFAPDLILADYKLPAFDGLSALEIAKEKSPDAPFIFVTGAMGEELAVESLKKGATDYVLKDRLYRLAPVVNRAMEEADKAIKRKQAENALMESEERYRVLTETANDAIICINEKDALYLWNKKAEEIFGYTAAEAIGKELHKLIVPENLREKSWEGLKGFFKTGEGNIINKTVELAGIKKDGTEFPLELSVSAMNVKGEWHATGIIRDITERKKLENELKDKLDIVERMNKLMVGRELELGKRRQIIEKLDARISELEKEKQGFKARIKELEG
ncbi:MAG: PAS domain S-box protein, partial [Deltaproteobacteria bacterium]|nr:PAS domain S-box protein [Deltaproteobacteria bacterium]